MGFCEVCLFIISIILFIILIPLGSLCVCIKVRLYQNVASLDYRARQLPLESKHLNYNVSAGKIPGIRDFTKIPECVKM